MSTRCTPAEDNITQCDIASAGGTPRGLRNAQGLAQTLCMRRTILHENRDIPCSLVEIGTTSREVKSKDVTLR